ncbi:pyridoxamine 5'-phosphate oxidase family protein [Methylocella sp.]|uniref:pyridoxamine 5'-phosphate oxidase family protein n=1 Tax=Methylocella sp. TaxID=1978226 RepID=UPI003783B587
MTEAEFSQDELRERLYAEVRADARIVMLGLVGEKAGHMQPMAAFVREGGGPFWFFTHTSTDLYRDAGAGRDAMACLMASDGKFQACVLGRLAVARDRAAVDEFWSPYVAAWHPGGKDDPELGLLRLDPAEARLWIAKSGALGFAYEIAKANLTKTLPEVGVKADLAL